jgi:hypothetical protein
MRYLIIIAAIVLVSANVYSQSPGNGYIGLFADNVRSNWCVQGAGFYPIEMWVWCLPNDEGLIDVENFTISYPSNVLPSTVTYTPDCIYLDLECLNFIQCWTDWNWYFHQTLYVTDPSQSVIEIIPVADDAVDFISCPEEYSVYQGIVYTNLYINYDPSSPECMGTAVESATWGSIKGLLTTG